MKLFGNNSNPSLDTIPKGTFQLKNYCNSCPYVEVRRLNKNSDYYNWFCAYNKKQNDGELKLIDFKVKLGSFVEKPSFCKKDEAKDKERERLKKWKSIKGKTSFNEIEEGCVYHVPPVNGEKRFDILIVRKYPRTFEYRIYNSDDSRLYYMYDDELAIKFMTKIKV